MKHNNIESLESRVLFAVTITNGLEPGSADFFSVTVGPVGSLSNATYGNVTVLGEYVPYIDFGSSAVTYDLSSAIDNAALVVGAEDPTVRSSGTGFGNFGTGTVTITATTTIPFGTSTVNTTYEIVGQDLRTGTFIQYLDPNIGLPTDDVLTIEGTIVDGDLIVGTVDQGSGVQASLRGAVGEGVTYLSFGASPFPELKNRIEDGLLSGAVLLGGPANLVAGQFPGIGEGYGPRFVEPWAKA